MALPTPSPSSTAVITGASSGIGTDIARELADRGHGVTLVARREDRLRELADELAGRGSNVEIIVCDVADSAARAGLFDEVDRRGLTADILVNNAGIGTIGSVTKTPVEDEIAQVRVNVEAVIDLTTRAVQQMVPRGRGRSSTSDLPLATNPSRGRSATPPPRRSSRTTPKGCAVNSPAPASRSHCCARARCAPNS